jgi:WD40 repeat protein
LEVSSTVQGHDDQKVAKLHVFDDGTGNPRLVSAGDKAPELKVWDGVSLALLRAIPLPAVFSGITVLTGYSLHTEEAPFEKLRVVVGSAYGHLAVYDSESGLPVSEAPSDPVSPRGRQPILSATCFEPSWAPGQPHVLSIDGDIYGIGRRHGYIVRIWQGETGVLTVTLPPKASTTRVALFRTRKEKRDRVVTATPGGGAVFDAETGAEVRGLSGHAAAVTCILAYPSSFGSDRVLTGSRDNTIRVWDPDASWCLCKLRGEHRNTIAAMCTFESDDGSSYCVASADEDGVIVLWHLGDALPGRYDHLRPAHKLS